jgi:poly(3-hydroxybutyrate) depolymerase
MIRKKDKREPANRQYIGCNGNRAATAVPVSYLFRQQGDIMIRHSLIAVACVASLAASVSAQTKTTLSIQVAGKTRSCAVYVPSGATKPPVVFFIHGATGSGGNFENETKGDVTAEKEKFIALYPSASSNGASGTWDDMQGTGNFPFFMALLDTMDARYHIDRTRVYMTGFSQGGFISFAAACFYSDIFAAVAPVSGHSGASCTIKRPVPMYMTFGAQEGAASFLKDRDSWLKWDKCPTTETITKPFPASLPNSKNIRVTYGPCDQGSQVLVDSIVGQGHQWPSASNGVQADLVWAFFKPYSLTGTTAVQPQKSLASRAAFTASYAAGTVRLGGIADAARVQVTNSKGELVATEITKQNQFAFKD